VKWGAYKRPDFINIDCRREVKPDLVVDLEKEFLRMFKDESVEEICMKDFLEHLSWRVVDEFLEDCHRVLKRRGKVWIQTPDLEVIAKQVILDPDFEYGELSGYKAISFWTYGEQNYLENLHKCGFTMTTLKQLLEQVGFKVDEIRSDGGSNMIVEAHKP